MKRIISILSIIALMLSFTTLYANAYEEQWIISDKEGINDDFEAVSFLGFVGDVDASDNIDIKDVTYIQLSIADKLSLFGANSVLADVDRSGETNIFDATSVQKWIAKLPEEAPVYCQLGTNEDVHYCKYSMMFQTNKCQDGGTYYECNECGDSFWTDYVEASHNWEVLKVVEPSCRDGYTFVKCRDCDELDWIDYVDAVKEHDWRVLEVVEASCEDGYTRYKCNGCGQYNKGEEIEGTGHDYEVIDVVEAGCEDGYSVVKCKKCSLQRFTDYTEGTGHIWGDEETVVPADCDSGYTKVDCTVCGAENKYDWVSGTGHNMGDWIVYKEAQIGIAGEERCYCSVCGDYWRRESDALVEGNQDVILAAQEMLDIFRFSVDYFDTVDQAFGPESYRGAGSFTYTFYLPLNSEGKYEIDEETGLRVYKRADLDKISLKLFGRTYDWESKTTPYDYYEEEYYDKETDTVHVKFLGGFGAGTDYRVSSCTENSDGTYTIGIDTKDLGYTWKEHSTELVLKETEYGYSAVSFRKFK